MNQGDAIRDRADAAMRDLSNGHCGAFVDHDRPLPADDGAEAGR